MYYDPDTEIVITTGGAEAMENVLFAFLDEGDEAIVLSPAYVCGICGACKSLRSQVCRSTA